MTEEQKRENIENARHFDRSDTYENHMLRFMVMQINLLADISETLLDMQKGAKNEQRGSNEAD